MPVPATFACLAHESLVTVPVALLAKSVQAPAAGLVASSFNMLSSRRD
jgi:hypothetical protein